MKTKITKITKIFPGSCMVDLNMHNVELVYNIGIVPMEHTNKYSDNICVGTYSIIGPEKNVESFIESKKWSY